MTGTGAVAITGATGFIGSALVARFLQENGRVLALSRTPPVYRHANLLWRRYALEDPVALDTFEGVDALIHTAYLDERSGDVAVNVAAGKRLADAAHAAAVGHRMFISSLAAGAGGGSGYAKQKMAIEQFFSSSQDAVVRPGLVIGNGGLFARMREHLRKSSFVPLIGGGKQPLQTVYVEDLVEAVVRIVERGMHGTFTLAQPEPVAYDVFYRELAAALHLKVRFVPVPFALAGMLVELAARLHLPVPVGRDNLLGLRDMVAQESAADWQRLNLVPRTYEQGIALAASETNR